MRQNKFRKMIPFVIVICLLVMFSIYLYKYNVVFVDSDAAGSMMYSKLMSVYGDLLTDKWFYSTTIAILDYPIIYSLFFKLTSNWLVVRTLGTFVVLIFYILSGYYLYKQLRIKHMSIAMGMLLMPFSIVYFGMYLAMPYYTFSNIKIFLTLGMVLKLINTENKKQKILLICFIGVLSLIQGLEGVRNIILFGVPLFLTMLIIIVFQKYKSINIIGNTNKTLIGICCYIVVLCGIGYLINSNIIAGILEINNYSEVAFGTITSEVIVQEINSWLTVFGHTNGNVFSLSLLHNILCYLMIIFSVIAVIDNLKKYKTINKNIVIFTLYYMLSVLILIYFAVFIDINKMGLYDVSRYNVPIAVVAVPLIIEWFDRNYTKNNITRIAYVLFAVLIIICGIDNYRLCSNQENKEDLAKINTGRVNNNTVELKDIAYMLTENGYNNGYSYFWCGNVLTELSNGKIEMWVWAPGGPHTKELTDLNERYKWLQLKDHMYRKPEGKVFLIFNQEELDYSKITNKLDWNNVIYNSDDFTVYGYNSNGELYNDFNN